MANRVRTGVTEEKLWLGQLGGPPQSLTSPESRMAAKCPSVANSARAPCSIVYIITFLPFLSLQPPGLQPPRSLSPHANTLPEASWSTANAPLVAATERTLIAWTLWFSSGVRSSPPRVLSPHARNVPL